LTFPKKGTGTSPTYQFLYASKHLQLTSSAAKNYASSLLYHASQSKTDVAYFVNNKGEVNEGTYKNGELRIRLRPPSHTDPAPPLEVVKLEDYKPGCAFYQRYNDAYNSAYIGEHNIGYVLIEGNKVENAFLTKGGLTSKRTWDFANNTYWEG